MVCVYLILSTVTNKLFIIRYVNTVPGVKFIVILIDT